MGQVTHIVGCIVGVWEYKGRPLEPINDSCLDALLKAAASDSWRLWCCSCGFQFDPKFMFGAKNSLECLLCQTKPLTVTQKETHKLQAGNYTILLSLCMCTCMRLSAWRCMLDACNKRSVPYLVQNFANHHCILLLLFVFCFFWRHCCLFDKRGIKFLPSFAPPLPPPVDADPWSQHFVYKFVNLMS